MTPSLHEGHRSARLLVVQEARDVALHALDGGRNGCPAVRRAILVPRRSQLLGELDAQLFELHVGAGESGCRDAHGSTSMPGRRVRNMHGLRP